MKNRYYSSKIDIDAIQYYIKWLELDSLLIVDGHDEVYVNTSSCDSKFQIQIMPNLSRTLCEDGGNI